jgi:hypothetical protein
VIESGDRETEIEGSELGAPFSRRLFRRDPDIRKLVVAVPATALH